MAAPPVSTRSTYLSDRRVAVVVCAAVGAVGFAHWSLADLSRDATTQQRERPFVLFFSALVFGLGVGMLVVARRVHAGARRPAWWVFGATCAASVTNLVEDGLGVESAFFAFVAELVVLLLSCVALAIIIALGEQGTPRFWAVIPLATIAAILLYVEFGGPLLLVTWLGAALACGITEPRRA